MSQVQSIGGETQVRAAIARAASASGVDFNFLLAQAKIESNLNPSARAGTSSATGLYQFTDATWLSTLNRHGAEYGLSWASDPAMRQQAMALRYDPQVSALMAAGLASDNKASLTAALGHEPDPAELYLGHFLGADGATRFLNSLAVNPSQSAASLMPAAAAANRAIFYRPDGSQRTVGEVMGLVRSKFAAAMEGGSGMDWAMAAMATSAGGLPSGMSAVPQGPIAQAFHAEARQSPSQSAPVAESPSQHSMAQVLKQAFAIGTPAATALPDHVRSAYAKLSAMGL